MNNDLIKKLLQKHFGDPRCSLTIGDAGEADGKIYFYTLEKEKEITAIRDLLGMKELVDGIEKLPELRQSIPDKGEDVFEIPECVSFRESEGNWHAYFHHITGVHYHRTYGNKVAATLQIDEHPFVTLSDRDEEFYGFWRKTRTRKRVPYNDRDGLSYWMNKALKTSARFRAFAVDFLFAVAEAERLYILKDVARTISNCGCFLPPVSFQNLLTFRTPADLIHSFQRENTNLNVDFNKVDINVGYIMVMLAPEVDRRDWKLISEFDTDKVAKTISLKLFYDGFTAEEFVKWYYRKKLKGEESEEEIRMFAQDYVAMCLEAGEKFRLNYGYRALVRAHEDLSIRIREKANQEEFEKPLVAVPSKFDELEAAIKNTGSTEFERIVTTERLLQEGDNQHNCVFSRRGLVRKDSASIYHWEHKGASYTIQFTKDRKGHYLVDEIRARFNKSITSEHLSDLKQMLSGVCDVDIKVERERPRAERVPGPRPRWRDFDWDDELFPDDLPF